MRETARTRRQFLGAAIGAPVAMAVMGVVGPAGAQPRARPTPACGGPGTPEQTEGPYWKPSSPLRASLVDPGMSGTRLVIAGVVMGTDCAPIPRAVIDVWQADDRGRYDTAGFRLRGHQVADAEGRYRLETIVPGVYPGRTRHIHVKVAAPGKAPLTTQLYFPNEPGNRRDGIFDAALVLQIGEGSDPRATTFDFVLA